MKAKLWAGDTEDDSKGNVLLLNFFDGKKHHTFRERSEAINFLAALKGPHHFWFCNLQYDLVNIFGNDLYWLEIIYINSRIIEARIIDTDIRFRDTLNHWKISVAEMGKRIGLKKLEAKGNKNKYDDVRYCRRDTKITFKFVESMSEKYESIGCTLKATIGSTALKLFQDKFHKMPTKRIFSKKDIEFMLRGYYGGRTEIFFNKPVEGNIQYFDINSLYPAMCKRSFPVLKARCFRYTKKPDFNLEGICHALVSSPEKMHVPYLPTRDENNRLIFPLGKFKGYWTYFELRRAVELGYRIHRIYKAIEFTRGLSNPMREFVDTLYSNRLSAREAKDDLLADAYKLLMNNLYGKFAQGNEKTKLVPLKKGTKIKRHDEILGCMVLKKEKDDYPQHTNVIWSAYVTAYGRDELWRKMNEIHGRNGLLIYCDTDSVIFEHAEKLFDDSKELGEFKLEGLFKYAHFRLPKEYKLISVEAESRPIYKAKGVPKGSQKDFFENRRVSFQRPYKLREVLRRNLSPKRKIKLQANVWDEIEKVSKKIYDKRIVHKSGHTDPLVIGGNMK